MSRQNPPQIKPAWKDHCVNCDDSLNTDCFNVLGLEHYIYKNGETVGVIRYCSDGCETEHKKVMNDEA